MNAAQRIIITALAVAFVGAAALTYTDNQKLQVVCGSNQYKIGHYLFKMESNLNNPTWNNDRFVKGIRLGDGSIDLTEARKHFIERGIMSGEDFDAAVDKQSAAGYVTNGAFRMASAKMNAWQNVEDACVAYYESLVPPPIGVATSTP